MKNSTEDEGPDVRDEETRQLIHDLNNALNALSMQAQLAEISLKDGDSDTAAASLTRIMEKCADAAKLSGALQTFFLRTANRKPSE